MWGRVGSTLMMQLLGTSDAIAFNRDYPCEDRVVSSILHLLQPFAGPPPIPNGWWMDDPERLWWMDPDWLHAQPYRDPFRFADPTFDREDFHRRAVLAVWTAYTATEHARRPSVRYYAEKYGDYAEILTRAEIPVKFVDVVRDPRDVWLSIRAFDIKRDSYGFGRREGQKEKDFLMSFLHAVRRRLDVMIASEDDPKVKQVRYEQLITDLAGQAEMLSRWLSVELQPAFVEESREDFQHHMTSASPRRSVGRWRHELSAAEASAFEAVLGDHLVKLGYARDGEGSHTAPALMT
jgi:hypothetical protein